MTRKPNCINPFEEDDTIQKNNEDIITPLPYIAPSIETILANPGAIIKEISENIQKYIATMASIDMENRTLAYEKKILPHQFLIN
jgi:hypothetical protein